MQPGPGPTTALIFGLLWADRVFRGVWRGDSNIPVVTTDEVVHLRQVVTELTRELQTLPSFPTCECVCPAASPPPAPPGGEPTEEEKKGDNVRDLYHFVRDELTHRTGSSWLGVVVASGAVLIAHRCCGSRQPTKMRAVRRRLPQEGEW